MSLDEIMGLLTENEQEFVKQESDFINGRLHHTKEVAQAMARDHRYLVEQRFKLFLEYFKELAKNYRTGFFDPRNEWACKCARVAIDALIESGDLYIPYDEREELGLPKVA